MGEFGAVSVVSGHIRGLTNTMPLHVEILYNDYDFAASFAVASLLTLAGARDALAQDLLEWRRARPAREGRGATLRRTCCMSIEVSKHQQALRHVRRRSTTSA